MAYESEAAEHRRSILRVLVTGGAGFIGANLCRRLLADGYDVVVVDDLSTGYRSNLDGVDVDFRLASILDLDLLAEAARGIDCIVHLAALGSVPRSIADPAVTNDVNVNGTMNVLLAARGQGAQVLFASSSSVYGANQELPKREDMRPRPLSPYAVSKLAGECYVLVFQHVYELPTLAFRFFNVYGPLQAARHAYAAVVPSFVDSLLNDRPLTVYGDGTQCRDFTSVGSVVNVLADAVARRITDPEPVNLAFGTSTTLLKLIDTLRELTGLTLKVIHGEPRRGDVRASQAANARLLELFPAATPQTLRDGLKETLDWFHSAAARQN